MRSYVRFRTWAACRISFLSCRRPLHLSECLLVFRYSVRRVWISRNIVGSCSDSALCLFHVLPASSSLCSIQSFFKTSLTTVISPIMRLRFSTSFTWFLVLPPLFRKASLSPCRNLSFQSCKVVGDMLCLRYSLAAECWY